MKCVVHVDNMLDMQGSYCLYIVRLVMFLGEHTPGADL